MKQQEGKKFTEERLRKLPLWIQKIYLRLSGSSIPSKVVFIATSILATVWFLVRVIPKPSRATYPCMQVVAPIMSSFIIWLLAVTGSWMAFKKARSKFAEARYLAGAALLITGVTFAIVSTTSSPDKVSANEIVVPWYQPNEPVGQAKGIFPGRVAWVHQPGTATWDGKTGDWWEDRFNNQEQVTALMKASILQITKEKDEKAAWNALFVHFNKTKRQENHGYRKGEKIAIKVNQNNTYSQANSPEINVSPHLVLSLIESLVLSAGVPEEAITVFDASRFITDNIFNKCHAIYPNVIFVDNSGGNGRVTATYVEEALPYTNNNGRLARGLATCAVEADYLINMAVLKGHVGQGVTLCAKNYYGVTSIHADWRRNVHNNFNQDREGKPKYMTFVDFMGHKDLGNKTMLFLVDGIYGNKLVDGIPGYKFQMAPFNNDWPSSLFASQDMVAIDAVCSDFILNEWPDAPDLKYCDAYLIEAAKADNAPSGTTYDPEGDGTSLKSLGVFEHWNNAIDKKYSRNLNKGEGIELTYTLLN